jgi:type IX secretion system PorP/SprF family membrane protein
VNGAPNSLLINGEANLPSLLRLSPVNAGVGINVVHDAIGFNRQTNVMLNYSQHFDIGNGKLGVGVGLGLFSFGLNPVWVPPNTLNDASLPAGSSAMTFDANFGAFYKSTDWYAGISSTHLTAPVLEQKSILGTGTVEYNGARHYYFMGGYTLRDIGPGNIDFQMLGQTDAVKTSINLNARYIYENFLYGGLAFRNSDAVSVLLGWKALERGNNNGFQNLWVGYSYDLTIGKIASISNGTHEIAVKYCFIPKMKVTKHKHPRWL